MTAVDHLANNDPLRAMDVLLQRVKAINWAHKQGNWNQAARLVPAGGEGSLARGQSGLVSSDRSSSSRPVERVVDYHSASGNECRPKGRQGGGIPPRQRQQTEETKREKEKAKRKGKWK